MVSTKERLEEIGRKSPIGKCEEEQMVKDIWLKKPYTLSHSAKDRNVRDKLKESYFDIYSIV